MSFFNTNIYEGITEEDIRELEDILNYKAFSIAYKKQVEKTKKILKRTYRDEFMIGVYSVLKMMLTFKSGNNKYLKVDIEPEEFANVCYEALLAMTNNKRIFNRVTNLANDILNMDEESARKTLDEMFKIEIINMGFNIYDKMDVFEKSVENNKTLDKGKEKIRVK